MKTRNIIIAAALVCMTAACTKEAERFHGTDKKSNNPMSSTELKSRIQDEVVDAINQISLTSETDLIELAAYFEITYSSYSLSEDYMKQLQEKCFSRESNLELGAVGADFINGMAQMLKAPSAAVQNTYKDLYTYSLNLKNVAGVFTANESTHKFDYAPASDRFELRFKDFDGKNCSFVIKGSSKSTRVHIDQLNRWSDSYYTGEKLDSVNFCTQGKTFDIDVPTSISATINAGKEELASLTIKSGVALESVNVDETEWEVNLEGIDPENDEWPWVELMDTSIVSVNFDKLSVAAVLKAEEYSVKADAIAAKGKAKESAGLYKGSKELLSECISLPYNLKFGEAIDSLHVHGNRGYAAAVLTDKVNGTIALGDVYVTAEFDIDRMYDDDAMSKISSMQEFIDYQNTCQDIRIYYGERKWQARLVWGIDHRFGPTIMIEFADGTMYSTSEVLTVENFSRALMSAQGLMMDLGNRFSRAIDKFTPEGETPEVPEVE